MTFATPFFDVSRDVSVNVSHLFSIWDTSRPRRRVSGVPLLCAPFRAQRWDTGHMLDVSHPCVPIMRTHLRPIAMVPPWPKTRRDAAGNRLALFDSLFCKSGIYLRGPHSRATVRASCQPGELTGPRHGWRPGATWRGRGEAHGRIGMDFVAAPGTAGLANARRGKARDGVSRASVKPGINPNRRHDDED